MSILRAVRRRVAISREVTKRRIQRILQPGTAPKKQIVVCGYARAGTSLLYNMLSATLEGFAFTRFECAAASIIWRYENGASKFPADILGVPELPSLNIHRKKLYAIVLIRDLRDIITSIHPTGPPDRYYQGYRFYWGLDKSADTWVRVAIGIKDAYEAINRAKTAQGIKLLFVRYEHLVENPDSVQQYLADQLEVSFARRFSEFHVFRDKHAYTYCDMVTQPTAEQLRENSTVDETRKGRWRSEKHRDRIYTEFTAYPALFRILREYGYEPDDSWFKPYRRHASSSKVETELDASS